MRRLCLHKNGLQAHTTGKPLGLAKKMSAVVYVPQDATVRSRWDGFSRVGALEVQTKIAYVPQDAKRKSNKP